MIKSLNQISKIFRFSTQKPQVQQKLFTPGPLNTSMRVKQTMNFDYGSRDPKFVEIIHNIRQDLLNICNLQKGKYECILIQGSGTYGIEATLGTSIPKDQTHKLLICINGAYGDRMVKIAKILNINHITLKFGDNEFVKPQDLQATLLKNLDVTHVACVHSETTSGIINPIDQIGKIIKQINNKIIYIVDAMSSFGAYPIYPEQQGIDYLVASSNKNLQGVPGFAFVIVNNEVFKNTQENARSLVLDLYDQWKALEGNGQFRFTPPTHVLRATKEAIDEFLEQGGIVARYDRYYQNQKLLTQRMEDMGFKLYIEKENQGCIITTFIQPIHNNFQFKDFYEHLASLNLVIYPGKLTVAETFRIGSIGEIYQQDFVNLTNEIKFYLKEKNIPIPVPY